MQSAHTIAVTFDVNASTFYVDAAQSDDFGDGTTWATAKKTIQSAADMVASGGTVWVTNGIYDIGGAVAQGTLLTNRVCITRAIVVRSVNGPEVTVIKGASGSNGSNDVNSIRGVCMTAGSLIGFTVTNGYTMKTGDCSGGGVWLTTNCVVSSCILNGNFANNDGGGAFLEHGGMLNNCELRGNSASRGGGAFLNTAGVLNNCTMSGNLGSYGTSAYLYYGGMMNNCIAWNDAAFGIDVIGGNIRNTCALNGGSITNNPRFMDAANGDFRLQSDSLCINAGNNAYAPAGTDMAGNPRIIGGVVDMGAYEFYAPQDDCDSDGLSNEWESRHFGNITRAAASEMCSNGVNTILQAYIAGLNPNDPESRFAVSVSGQKLRWNATSGRVYAVYYSTNLLSGFEPLGTNILWTADGFTDGSPNAEQRFYRVEVRKP